MSPRSREKIEGNGDELPPEEADRRRDDALRRALSMPPARKGKGEDAKPRRTEKRARRSEGR